MQNVSLVRVGMRLVSKANIWDKIAARAEQAEKEKLGRAEGIKEKLKVVNLVEKLHG